MKTKKIIALFFLTGLALTGFSQGKVENNGGYLKSSSTSYFKFGGSGDITLKSTNADRTTFGNMEADFTGTGTYKLTIPDDSYITVNGNLVLSDTLLLEASSNGMASLITNGTVTGNYAEVQQHLPTQDEWHIVSSPVSNEVSGVYAGLYLLDWYEPDSLWSYITSTTDPLNVTEGYFVWSASSISSPVDVSFIGLLNTGNQTVANLTYNDNSGEGHGWNLIGNPYPSAIEWNSLWTKTNIDATIYVYDGNQYLTWNYNLGGYGSMGIGDIPSTQGFWVKANASNPALTIPNSERLHSSQAFYKGSDFINNIIEIEIYGNGYSDEAIVGMVQGANNAFDSEYDAYKIYGIEDAPQLFSCYEDLEMAANFFPNIVSEKIIRLGLKIGIKGQYTFNFLGLDNFDNSIDVYLEDKLISGNNRSFINLRENPVYSFTTNAGTEINRFVLHFNKSQTDIYNNPPMDGSFNEILIYSYEKNIYVNYRNSAPALVIVYDLLGKEIFSKSLVSFQMNRLPVNIGRGYYIVKVVSEKTIKTKKVFIN
ncbi:MAG: T9SS type A sorting domain-containing protein [Bacteroidetes bacterium]|nr:T9SS type A sorting domain-containing protein [Bacteroidota bacterium]MBL7103011.1 T9SS type A sorting domain-containing protein [Bacteroidales bacterium]